MKALQQMATQVEAMTAQVEQLLNPQYALRVNMSWLPRTQLLLLPNKPEDKQHTLEEARKLAKLIGWMAGELKSRPRPKSKTVVSYTISAPPAAKLGIDFSSSSVIDQTGRTVATIDELMACYIESGIAWKPELGALADYLGGYLDERQATDTGLAAEGPGMEAADSGEADGPGLDLPW